MTDPYKILGIQRDATDEEIKRAYRNLSRKYHPDANVNNPNKAEAEERFKEVQQAYNQIIKEKEYGNTFQGNPFEEAFGGYYGHSYSSHQNQDADYYRAAISYIQNGYYHEALNVLTNIENRDGKWYYLSAIANNSLGNNVLALEHAKTAVEKEPYNQQYQMLLRKLQMGESWYQTRQQPFEYRTIDGSGYCFRLCIANILCNLCCQSGGLCCIGSPYKGV